MSKKIGFIPTRITGLLLMALPCFCLAQTRTPDSVNIAPEKTINGVRYWQVSNELDKEVDLWEDHQPTLSDLRDFGFVLNYENEDTYIAPDGKIVPKFHDALRVMAPNAYNGTIAPPEGAPSSYSGEIYLPDTIERSNFVPELTGSYYVLGFQPRSMAENLTAIRTSIYMSISTSSFKKAVGLKKVQIGSCYSVVPCTFWYSKQPETVILEKSPYIYRYAFAGCPDIKSVVLQSDVELPPFEDTSAFEDSVYKNATLYLPDTLMDKCNSDPLWSKFVHKKSLKECQVEFIKP